MAEIEPGAILVLGAEQQAATSLALAYPERRFLFASDCPVIDGWDLPNVRMIGGAPGALAQLLDQADEVVPLSARWQEDPHATALSTVLPKIEKALPGVTLPVSPQPGVAGPSVAKGDLWHRPDSPVTGEAAALADLADPHGCGIVYQRMIDAPGCVMAIGRRSADGATALGLFRVFKERFFRVDVLQAAESVDLPDLVEHSCGALAALAYEGWFTLAWLLTQGGPRLSSFRPVPKAAFRAFRSAGLDLLAPPSRDVCLTAGLRLIAMPHYASFDWLAP